MRTLPVRWNRSQLTSQIRLLRREKRRLEQKCRSGRRFYYVAACPPRKTTPSLRRAEGDRIFLGQEEAQERADRMNEECEGEHPYRVFQGLACDLRPMEKTEDEQG